MLSAKKSIQSHLTCILNIFTHIFYFMRFTKLKPIFSLVIVSKYQALHKDKESMRTSVSNILVTHTPGITTRDDAFRVTIQARVNCVFSGSVFV